MIVNQRAILPLPSHQAYLAMPTDIFSFPHWVRGYHWHLVDREQGCFQVYYNAQESSHNKKLSNPKCQEDQG